MRKITEKVAIVAQICITLVFVITTLLYIANVIPERQALANNGMMATLIAILAVVYALLSAYMLYVNFSEREALRQVLLFCDSESSTRANVKVVRNIVRSCAKKVNGVRVRKAKMRLDEKQGFVITLSVDVSGSELSTSIDKLRCLIADSFKNTLNLTFNSINFEIRKLKSHYTPNVERAEKLAKTLTEQRELSADIYEQPFQDNCENCKSDEAGENDIDDTSDKKDEETSEETNETNE